MQNASDLATLDHCGPSGVLGRAKHAVRDASSVEAHHSSSIVVPTTTMTQLMAQDDIVAPAEPFDLLLGHDPDPAGVGAVIVATGTGERQSPAGFHAEAAFPLDIFLDHALDGQRAEVVAVEFLRGQKLLLIPRRILRRLDAIGRPVPIRRLNLRTDGA